MAITKRLRFEILRRDGHTCQYCGEAAPLVTLHIDHVIPVALGGTDKPENLVAACKDCNLGKSSVPADAPLVRAVAASAAVYALELTDKFTKMRALYSLEADYLLEFKEHWQKWKYQLDGKTMSVTLPLDWRNSVRRWHRLGAPIELLEEAIEKAMTKVGLRGSDAEFTYMAGVIWRRIDEVGALETLTEDTVAVYTEAECSMERYDAYQVGLQAGLKQREETRSAQGQSEYSDGDLV